MTAWSWFATTLTGDGREEPKALDLVLTEQKITLPLSRWPVLTATVPPPVPFRPEPWATVVYAVHRDTLVGGFIISEPPTTTTAGGVEITGVGFSGYPHEMPYTGAAQNHYNKDTGVLFGEVWSNLQGVPGGDLGLRVPPFTSSVTVGRRETVTEPGPDGGAPTTREVDDPYTLDPHETHDLGQVIDDLVAAGGLEFRESHTLGPDGVGHTLEVAAKVGDDRTTSLVLESGVNLTGDVEIDTAPVTPTSVLVVGDGTTHVGTATGPVTGRLRRVRVVRARVASDAEATTRAEQALAEAPTWEVARVTFMDTPHTPITSIRPGDTVTINATTPAGDRLIDSARVLSVEYTSGDTATLELT